MNINKIAKEMTKEEFINCLVNEGSGTKLLIDGKDFDCPNELENLEQVYDNNGYCDRCRECWLNSINNIKFKDGLEETIIHNKTMNTIELLQFAQLEENQGKKLTCKNIDGKYHIKDKFVYWNDEYISVKHHLENNSQWVVIEEHWKEVGVLLALKSKQEGKEVKCELDNRDFNYEMKTMIFKTEDYPNTPISNIEYTSLEAILNGKWFVKE